MPDTSNPREMLASALRGVPSHLTPRAPWRVNLVAPWQASVEIERGTLANLPNDDTEESRAVLAHELGHVTFSRPPSVLPAAITRSPATLRLHTLLDEWRVDMRLVQAGHDPDPRIGMDRFDWSQVPLDAAQLPILDRALMWIQSAYIQTGAQNPTVGMRAAELWSLLDDQWRAALTDAYREINADPTSDRLHDAWALRLGSLVPPSAPYPRVEPHLGGIVRISGTPPATPEAQQRDQERQQDRRNADDLDRRAQREQDRPDTATADRDDRQHANDAEQIGTEEANAPQGPKGRGRTKAEHAQKLGQQLADDDDVDDGHPDANAAEHAEQHAEQELAETLRPKRPNIYADDPIEAAAARAQREAEDNQYAADRETGETGSPGMPSLHGSGPNVRGPILSDTERKVRMASGRESWHGQLIVHSHLSKDRDSTKRVIDLDGPSEYGTRVLDITRLWTDQRIFDRGARPGGTVIVDGSGSMGWSVRTLEDLILACPGVTVAVYFKPRGRTALPMLCIVAKDGLRADDFLDTCYQTASGGNDGSDLPALSWLAESHHRDPRVILSDGEYWTYGTPAAHYADRATYNDRCNSVMLLGRIVRVPTVPDLFAALTGQKAQISDGDMTYPTRLRAIR